MEWLACNKLVLNISQTTSIAFGTNYSLTQLNLVMNGVAVEQVETKLPGVTLDCKLSWSKRIDSIVGERSGRNKEILCFFDTTLQKASPGGSSFLLS